MKLKVIVHRQESGFWAEVPAIPGCATQADTLDDLITELKEAVTEHLNIEVSLPPGSKDASIVEVEV